MTIITEWCGWLGGWTLLRWAQCGACQTPSPFLLPSSHSHSPCASVPAYLGFAFSSLRHLWSRAAGSRCPSSDIYEVGSSLIPHHGTHIIPCTASHHVAFIISHHPQGECSAVRYFGRDRPLSHNFYHSEFLYILYFTIGYCCSHRCICIGKITYVGFSTIHGFGIRWGTGESPHT